jgi:hypothetical protein
VQVYDVQEGSRRSWNGSRARPARVPRLRRGRRRRHLDDLTRDGPALATVIGFRDDAALRRFLDGPAGADLGAKFDEFIGPHGHRVFRRAPVYRVGDLSG